LSTPPRLPQTLILFKSSESPARTCNLQLTDEEALLD
jgi:hypothetical protein